MGITSQVVVLPTTSFIDVLLLITFMCALVIFFVFYSRNKKKIDETYKGILEK